MHAEIRIAEKVMVIIDQHTKDNKKPDEWNFAEIVFEKIYYDYRDPCECESENIKSWEGDFYDLDRVS